MLRLDGGQGSLELTVDPIMRGASHYLFETNLFSYSHRLTNDANVSHSRKCLPDRFVTGVLHARHFH